MFFQRQQVFYKKKGELATMHRANTIVRQVLAATKKAAAPGVSTLKLDLMAEEMIREAGGKPSFKGYRGFPATLCISLNDVIVHGIPRADQLLEQGDLVSVDCGVFLDGYHGDSAISFPVGQVSPSAEKLMEVTRLSLEDAIEKVQPGGRLGDISAAVQARAESEGFGIVREFVGHGVGRNLHERPEVPNYGEAGRGQVLRPGLVLAIEPMLTLGDPTVAIDEDGWTARTKDGRLAAHFEFSVAVTDTGHWILGVEELN